MQLLKGVMLAVLVAVSSSAWARQSCDVTRAKTVRAVPVAAHHELTIATQNMARFFDDADDGRGPQMTKTEYRALTGKWARYIRTVLHAPAVLAVQEVENQRVLDDVARSISEQDKTLGYKSALIKGNDPGGINVGFLVRNDVVITEVESLMAKERLTIDRSRLFDRPPLRIRINADGREMDVVVVHMRSLLNSDHPEKGMRIALKRTRQAERLAEWLIAREQKAPAIPVVVLGDFNATVDAAGGVDALGPFTRAGLTHANTWLPKNDNHTYVYRCNAQALDHIFVSHHLSIARVAAARGNAWAQSAAKAKKGSLVGLSDHDALVVYLKK